MSLERKDVRAKLDHDVHAALTVLCDVDGVEIGEFIEAELIRVITKRIHDAKVIAERIAGAGLSGRKRE